MPYKKSITQFFDSYAREFDAVITNRRSIFQEAINKFFRKSTRLRFLKTIEACYPIEGKTVLDVGCGPGYYAVALARLGARKVLGVDISPAMIELAKEHAKAAKVDNLCEFIVADFTRFPVAEKFDYAIAQGFMDYIANPKEIIDKILSATKSKAFFSFPKDGGFLAWQRKLRYKWKCDLYLYHREQLSGFFAGLNDKRVEIEKISRDFFVTVYIG